MDKKILRHLPWIVWLALIIFFSLLPGNQLPNIKFDWIPIDTFVHVLMYGGLSSLQLVGFNKGLNKGKKNKLNLLNFKLYGWVILVGVLVGYTIELIQGNFSVQRHFDVTDIVANFFGTIFGVLGYVWTCRKLI